MMLRRGYSKTPEKTTEEKEFEEFLDYDYRSINALRRFGIHTIEGLKLYLQDHSSCLGIYGIGKTCDELIQELVRRSSNVI